MIDDFDYLSREEYLQVEMEGLSGEILALRARVAELEAAQPAPGAEVWIPVGERLPKPETDVLVYSFGRGCAVAGLFHGEWCSNETDWHLAFQPEFWQPLPAPPATR